MTGAVDAGGLNSWFMLIQSKHSLNATDALMLRSGLKGRVSKHEDFKHSFFVKLLRLCTEPQHQTQILHRCARRALAEIVEFGDKHSLTQSIIAEDGELKVVAAIQR